MTTGWSVESDDIDQASIEVADAVIASYESSKRPSFASSTNAGLLDILLLIFSYSVC